MGVVQPTAAFQRVRHFLLTGQRRDERSVLLLSHVWRLLAILTRLS